MEASVHPIPEARRAAADPPVTAVVLAYNRRDALRTTLERLTTALDYPALGIVVVDNASDDGTAAMVRAAFPQVRLIANARNEGVPGWNRGFAEATGRYVLILDDDAYLEGDALRHAVAAAEAEDADLVSFTVRSSVEPERTFNASYPTGLLSFWGCAALVRRSTLERLGGYDPNIFLWANELELTMRLLDGGGRHLHLPTVEAMHMKAPSRRGVYRYRAHRLNTRHHAYIAAKLLRGGDAVLALANLALGLGLTALRRPQAFTIFPALAAGIRDGLRARAPVRPSVSRLYRRNAAPFVSSVPYALRLRRPAAFYRRRAEYYPGAPATLSIP